MDGAKVSAPAPNISVAVRPLQVVVSPGRHAQHEPNPRLGTRSRRGHGRWEQHVTGSPTSPKEKHPPTTPESHGRMCAMRGVICASTRANIRTRKSVQSRAPSNRPDPISRRKPTPRVRARALNQVQNGLESRFHPPEWSCVRWNLGYGRHLARPGHKRVPHPMARVSLYMRSRRSPTDLYVSLNKCRTASVELLHGWHREPGES